MKEETIHISCQPGDIRDRIPYLLSSSSCFGCSQLMGPARLQLPQPRVGFALWGDATCFREQPQRLLISSKGTRAPRGGSDLSSLQPHSQPSQGGESSPCSHSLPTLAGSVGRCCLGFDRSSCSPDFHNNIFSRSGYISSQLLYHSVFQHKYMQCSAAAILLRIFHRLQKPHISLPRTEQPHHHSGG